ncbi:MAG TPA: polysaccharide deacetylase family protein [Marinilabiliaceae bacterium]|nr:polysaccharide deacetylase family protein [Marinilabiliaceae bacterium]
MKIREKQWQIQPPWFLRLLFPRTTWREKGKDKRVFITFDDGPIPEITPWVLETLKAYNAKATFFCVGDNVRKHPAIYQLLHKEGMKVGNHTYSHAPVKLGDFKTYLKDVELCGNWVTSELFRPPHGILFPWQIGKLKRKFKKIIMWDVLTMDYRQDLSPQQVFENLKKNVRSGSIIVFHDSLKAWNRIEIALPKSLEYLSNEGYTFDVIGD